MDTYGREQTKNAAKVIWNKDVFIVVWLKYFWYNKFWYNISSVISSVITMTNVRLSLAFMIIPKKRNDIAMAVGKHDMFDFLIDIVPRN